MVHNVPGFTTKSLVPANIHTLQEDTATKINNMDWELHTHKKKECDSYDKCVMVTVTVMCGVWCVNVSVIAKYVCSV